MIQWYESFIRSYQKTIPDWSNIKSLDFFPPLPVSPVVRYKQDEWVWQAVFDGQSRWQLLIFQELNLPHIEKQPYMSRTKEDRKRWAGIDPIDIDLAMITQRSLTDYRSKQAGGSSPFVYMNHKFF